MTWSFADFAFVCRAVAHLDATFESQKPTMQERIANLKYLESKSKEYAVSIQNLKDTFKQTSVTPSIYHSSLMQLYAHLSELDQQLQPKLKDLTGYMQLPPVRCLSLSNLLVNFPFSPLLY
jgi:hypothetical protein